MVRYLQYFTFASRDEIDELAQATARAPEQRTAQRELARRVTALVHGDDQVVRAERAAAVLFSEDIGNAEVSDILMVFEDAPSSEVALSAEGMALTDLLAAVKLTASKSEALRLVKSGGVYVNNVRMTDERRRLTPADAIRGELFVLRKGRKDHHVVKLRRG